jgi:hypothetical protein
MLQGESGLTDFHLFEHFSLNGSIQEKTFSFKDVGTLSCVHLRAFYTKDSQKYKFKVKQVHVKVTS